MGSKSKRFQRRPRTFRAMTGLSIEKFKELLPLYEKTELKRLNKPKRERRVGGGRKKELLLEDQLMMLLMYYRLYFSQEFLGIIFNLHNCPKSIPMGQCLSANKLSQSSFSTNI